MKEPIEIKRRRFVVMRNNRTEIWCGLARNYEFKPINQLGSASIKTYSTADKAKIICSSWDKDFEIVPIVERIIVLYDFNFTSDLT